MPKRVPPAEAAALMKQGWRYVDVRSIPEFEAGHPEGAVNVPILHMTGGRMVPNPDFQAVMSANFPPETTLVLGCKAGGRSLQAATLLEAAGYQNVVDMQGGFSGERDPYGRAGTPGWQESGLPVSTQAAPGASYEELRQKTKA